jgi:AraC-like DNA-binding protein
VMRRRLEKACHLMITTSESLSQIALSVGFSDQSHLTKRFKQTLGQSPSNWRRERDIVGIPWGRMTEKLARRIVGPQPASEKSHESRTSPQSVSSSAD